MTFYYSIFRSEGCLESVEVVLGECSGPKSAPKIAEGLIQLILGTDMVFSKRKRTLDFSEQGMAGAQGPLGG